MNLAAVATAAGVAYVLGRLTSRSEAVAARREASTDALTGLTNRAGLIRHMHNRARKGLPYVALLFDLNRFKPVNDTYGHRTGDQLLVTLARRVEAGLDGHVVARLGGDEFVVLLDGSYPAEVIHAFAERICRIVQRPITLSGVPDPVIVGAAVGATPALPREDPRCTLHAADQAMYRSKMLGEPYLQRVRTRAAVDESPRVRLRDTPRVRVT